MSPALCTTRQPILVSEGYTQGDILGRNESSLWVLLQDLLQFLGGDAFNYVAIDFAFGALTDLFWRSNHDFDLVL